jgi:hypothetical protein
VPVLRKLVSPAGFALALLCFPLPFVAVSCDTGAGSFEVTYSGLDLATGSAPSVSATGGLAQTGGGPIDAGSAPDPDVHLLGILTAVLLLAGIGTVLIRPVRARMLSTAALAGSAGALLVSTELVAMSQLRPPVRNVIESQFPDTTVGIDAALDGAISTRIGFWLALSALILVLLFTIAVAVRTWLRK